MSRRLRCPNCSHKLNNRFLLVFQIKNVGNKRLPCPKCGTELVDSNKYMWWVLMLGITLVSIGLVLGQSKYGLLYIFPLLFILSIWGSAFIPLKKEVKSN